DRRGSPLRPAPSRHAGAGAHAGHPRRALGAHAPVRRDLRLQAAPPGGPARPGRAVRQRPAQERELGAAVRGRRSAAHGLPALTTARAPYATPMFASPAPPPPGPIGAADADLAARAGDHSAGINSMRQLVQLRWIAVVGQLLTIAVVHVALRIALPLPPMLAVVGALAAFNLIATVRWRGRGRVTNTALLLGLLVDVAALTVQLYLSGGIANPFVFLYLLQVALAAVLLRAWSSWLIVALTCACVVGLALFPGPVTLHGRPDGGLSDPYVQGLLLCCASIATLRVVSIIRTGRIVRARDAHLAALRQRAAEEEHIVRMGLLASGAAHELGTPLSTLAVILCDFHLMPTFTTEPELLEDVTEMQAQVLRCKAIVSNI